MVSIQSTRRKNIVIPERPIIELLSDDRNTIQHRFGFPTALTVVYYLDQVIPFFTRFLKEQYNINLAEALEPYLSRENIALLGLIEDDYSHFKKLSQVSPEGAVLQAAKTIEREVEGFIDPISTNYSLWTLPFPILSIKLHLSELVEKKYLPDDIIDTFYNLQYARNQIPTPLTSKLTNINWESALDIAIQFLTGLSKAKKGDFFKSKTDNDEPGKSN